MPITPLHFGAALPFELALRGRFSTVAFVLANVVMDVQPVLALGFAVPVAVHGWTHSLLGASLLAAAMTALSWRLPRRGAFAAGFFAGTLTHVGLDALMHHDLSPLWPWREGNPVIERVDVNISRVMLAPTALWLAVTLWRVHRDQRAHPARGWRARLLAM
jgi:membrane-bound metal-dependent hydrolase YbcI (DUF457 family)